VSFFFPGRCNKKGILCREKIKKQNGMIDLDHEIKYWIHPDNKTNKTIETIQLFYDT
jgi:hypothetical protein